MFQAVGRYDLVDQAMSTSLISFRSKSMNNKGGEYRAEEPAWRLLEVDHYVAGHFRRGTRQWCSTAAPHYLHQARGRDQDAAGELGGAEGLARKQRRRNRTHRDLGHEQEPDQPRAQPPGAPQHQEGRGQAEAENLAIIGMVGASTLWRNGIALADLRIGEKTDDDASLA